MDWDFIWGFIHNLTELIKIKFKVGNQSFDDDELVEVKLDDDSLRSFAVYEKKKPKVTETFCQTVAENLNNIVFFFIYNKLIDVPVIFFSNKAATAQVQAESGSAFLFVIRRLKNNYLK